MIVHNKKKKNINQFISASRINEPPLAILG
jgi:hypothetical protein